MKKLRIKSDEAIYDYERLFGQPRLEMTGRECLVDGLQSILEYSDSRIIVSLGSQRITFNGYDLRINSFTKEGAVVEGDIISMEFSSQVV